MPDFGLGTYRVSDVNALHIDAIVEAIRGGIRLIDTATNYYDGGSERAIAKALERFDASIRSQLKIVSKFGYVQGTLLREYKQKDSSLRKIAPGAIACSNECYYSLEKSFVHHQLSESLRRLQCSQIESYLVHNPENYLYDAVARGYTKEAAVDKTYERLYEAFAALEEEVEAGRINGYGVSSNAFARAQDDPEFLPYLRLIETAEEAARAVGRKHHALTTIELPINIVETQGLACAAWAKSQDLIVLANRALSAVYEGQIYLLADYEEHRDYYTYLNELLEFCDNELLQDVYNLILSMDERLHTFTNTAEYDRFVHAEVLPFMQRKLQALGGDTVEKLLQYFEWFLVAYRQMVAVESAKKTKRVLSRYFRQCDETLQRCALGYLLQQKDVDYILVGARRIRYVYDLLTLRDELSENFISD